MCMDHDKHWLTQAYRHVGELSTHLPQHVLLDNGVPEVYVLLSETFGHLDVCRAEW